MLKSKGREFDSPQVHLDRNDMKVSNLYIYGTPEYLSRLEEDYVFMGRAVRLEEGRLVVFALPKRKKSKRAPKNKPKRR
jgi:hypothetical protein